MNHNDENAAHFDAAAFWLDMIVQFIRDLPAREGEVSEAAQLMIDITRVMADLKNGTGGEAQAFVDNPASFDAAMLKNIPALETVAQKLLARLSGGSNLITL